jgi:hypothetical protein
MENRKPLKKGLKKAKNQLRGEKKRKLEADENYAESFHWKLG